MRTKRRTLLSLRKYSLPVLSKPASQISVLIVLMRGLSRRYRHSPSLRRSMARSALRSEEHTSELQSRENLVCRLLLEKKKNKYTTHKNGIYVQISPQPG